MSLRSEPLSASQPTDSESVARACLELGRDWRGAIREYHRLRRQTIQLVDQHWAAIRLLAQHLSQSRTLTRVEFLAILEYSRAVAG